MRPSAPRGSEFPLNSISAAEQTVHMSFVSRLAGRGKSRRSFEEDFAYRADDVVIASYPKSGSTWVRFILTKLLAREAEVDFLQAQLQVPEISKHAQAQGVNYELLASPRFMRTHAECYAACPRAVYLLRDGRDVMVSYYFHFQKFHEFTGTLFEFLESDRRPSEWNEHVDSWIFNNAALDRMCVIRYEDLLQDTARELRKLVDFGGLKTGDAELRRAIDECTLEKMKAVEKKKGLGHAAPGNPDIAFIRKGGSGNWREHFGDQEKTVFKARHGLTLIKAGYESSMDW